MILIENYPKFKDLSKKQCFNYIAALLDQKEPKQCYDRYKKLDLKHLSSDEAKARAEVWHSEKESKLLEQKILKTLIKIGAESISGLVTYLE